MFKENIEDIYKSINKDEIKKTLEVQIEKSFAKVTFKIPGNAFFNEQVIPLMLPGKEVNKDEIVIKLCEKVKEVDYLKRKVNFLFNYLGVNDKDMEEYEKLEQEYKESKVISSPKNIALINEGLQHQIGKRIKK